jgi:hypothetical protein
VCTTQIPEIDGRSYIEERRIHRVFDKTPFHFSRHASRPRPIDRTARLPYPGSLQPVTQKSHSVANGSVYGRGIYSSPQAWYAMMYGDNGERTTLSELPGCKLLVCAYIMGRTAVMAHEDNWQERTEPFPGADSHVNESQYAYIVFNAAQILPCYVLHLDYAERGQTQDLWDMLMRSQRSSSSPSSNNKTIVGDEGANARLPGAKQRKKGQQLAKGQKFFAYGYGPVGGDKLVDEDVADVSEDEEDYGEYQLARAVQRECGRVCGMKDGRGSGGSEKRVG